MRFNAPSPEAATDVSGFMPAVGGCLVVAPVDDVEPQAVMAMIAAADAAARRAQLAVERLPFISPLLWWLRPGRKRGRGTMPPGRGGLRSPGACPGRPYSAVQPRVTPHGRDGPRSG